MAMGVPTVCTHIGFEGLQIVSGQGVIMAKEKEKFILEVNTLLSDTAKRQSVGEQGLEIARTSFSWDKIALKLETYLQEVARR
jgi:glycosyltransferase involved in cell wall biosynthesis